MRNTLKRKLLGSLLAAAMTVSCFSVLLAVPATAQAEEREATFFEGFEDMDGYTYTAADTILHKHTGNPTVTIDNTVVHSGKSSLKFVAKASATTKKMIRIRTDNGQVQVKSGNKYHISFYYYTPVTGSGWDFCYTFCSTNDWGMNDAALNSQNELATNPIGNKVAAVWHRADVVFTAGKATDKYKYLTMYIQGGKKSRELYIDDISVTQIADDDNVVIVNTPAGKKAVYGKMGDDYSVLVDRKYNDQYLAGIYTDSSSSAKVSSTVFSDETTPIKDNIPTTVYAVYADRAEHNFKFDSYEDNFELGYKAESGCSIALSDEKALSGSTSLKFTGSSNSAVSDANVRLDKQSAYDAKIKVGSTYLVSFKYFVDSDNTMQFYYNFAADVYQNDNLNSNTGAAFGYQMIGIGNDGNYYAASKHLSGTKANGWQTQTVQFTVQKGESTIGNPDRLILCLRSANAVGSVYIDDVTVTELFDKEYAVVKNANNGNEPTIQIGYEGDSFTLDTPVYEGSAFDGWYTDSALTTALTADKFGSTETPVTNYVPFTAYAKWNIRTFATFDFESFSSDTNLPVRTDSNNNTQTGMKIELNTDSQYSKGNNSLKFYSDTDGANARGNIMLEKTPSDGTRVNIGDTYLITFKYFVDSSYSMEWYYNFAIFKWQSNNLNYSLSAANGRQIGSKRLSGSRSDGWQTAVCQFTADISQVTNPGGDCRRLLLYVQGNGVQANVPLYIDDIVVTKLYEGEYAAQIIKNNGEEKVVCYGSVGDNIPLETPVRAHYDFTGWYTDSDCTTKLGATKFGSTSTPLVDNIPFVIYAGWKNATNYIKVDSEIENGLLTVDCTKETVTVEATKGYQLVPGSLKFKFTYGGKEYVKPIANPVAGNDNAYSFTGLLNDEIRVGTIVVTAEFAQKQDITGAAVASALRKANVTQTEGIRFLNRFYASEATLKAADFGAIVTPYDNIEALGITEVTLADLEKVRGKNILAENNFCYTTTAYRDYAIAITDVQDKNREFAVIPYMTYNGTTVYGTMEVRSYNDAEEYSNIGCEIYDSSVSGNAKSLNKKYVEEFSEDFDGTALNTSRFRVDSTPETSSAENVSVANGSLNLSVKGTSANAYTSAYVSTNQLYNCSASSYVEIRAKLPMNKGRNTGFWLKTVSKDGIAVEIDVAETYDRTDRIQANVYVWDTVKNERYSLDQQTLGSYIEGSKRGYDLSGGEYHTFGLERSETAYKFYCDGNLFFTYDLTKLSSSYGVPETYKQYFLNDAYLIMSDSVLSTATDEQVSDMGKSTYQIDYVKSYRLSAHNMYEILS